MKPVRVLLLTNADCVPPADVVEAPQDRIPRWRTEFDVLSTLRSLGHEVRVLGVAGDLAPLREALDAFRPDVVFVMIEEFAGRTDAVPYVVGYLDLVGQPYTGCCPDGLLLASGKALQKKILRHHRIPVPDFAVFPRGAAVRRPPRLPFPLIVKSTTAHGSIGIAQASVVADDKRLRERVEYIHDEVETDAIVEQYIDGRELYVGLIGNQRVQTLPVWELIFEKLPPGSAAIATERMKWDVRYQNKLGIDSRPAADLPDGLVASIRALCRRAFRALRFTGYARMDLRLSPEGEVYLLECNPNPNLAYGDDFAASADLAGLPYARLVERIVALGLKRRVGAPVTA